MDSVSLEEMSQKGENTEGIKKERERERDIEEERERKRKGWGEIDLKVRVLYWSRTYAAAVEAQIGEAKI